ncbi:MAG: ribosome maturation factor RimM [Anaerolineales bacterium]|jgi:16S rRNA processing protein RimM
MTGHAKRTAGSPTASGPSWLAVGKVRRPHGVAGDALVEVYTDFPERLKPTAVVYAGETHIQLTIRRQRSHNDGILLAFDGYSTPEQVGRFRNQILYIVEEDAMELPEGEFYYHELQGLSVIDENGKALGKVTEIMQTGANDVYVVTNDAGREILLPAISEVILDVDLDSKIIKAHLLPGLMEEGDRDL